MKNFTVEWTTVCKSVGVCLSRQQFYDEQTASRECYKYRGNFSASKQNNERHSLRNSRGFVSSESSWWFKNIKSFTLRSVHYAYSILLAYHESKTQMMFESLCSLLTRLGVQIGWFDSMQRNFMHRPRKDWLLAQPFADLKPGFLGIIVSGVWWFIVAFVRSKNRSSVCVICRTSNDS